MTNEQVREVVREADYCFSEPPAYADQILISQVPNEKTWLVTAEHGDPVTEKAQINRYVVTEHVTIKPVDEFPKAF